jgi:tetratricopeptide (TPR) repeat protein
VAREQVRKSWLREMIVTAAGSVTVLLIQHELGRTGKATEPRASPTRPATSPAVRSIVLRYFERGKERAQAGEYGPAVGNYTEAIRLDPAFTEAYLRRGWAFGRLGQFEQAIQDFTEALRLDPSSAYAYANRGWAYAQVRHYEQAIQDCTQAIRLDPNLAPAYHIRSWACAQHPAPARDRR